MKLKKNKPKPIRNKHFNSKKDKQTPNGPYSQNTIQHEEFELPAPKCCNLQGIRTEQNIQTKNKTETKKIWPYLDFPAAISKGCALVRH